MLISGRDQMNRKIEVIGRKGEGRRFAVKISSGRGAARINFNGLVKTG
jgi:hypothetical protein